MSFLKDEDRLDSCLPAISTRPLSASALNQGPVLDRDRRVRFVGGTSCERGRGFIDGAYVNIRPISPTYNIRRQATDPAIQQANHVRILFTQCSKCYQYLYPLLSSTPLVLVGISVLLLNVTTYYPMILMNLCSYLVKCA